MDLSILIVTYNSHEKLKTCLRSVFAFMPKNLSIEVIVYDNHSEVSPKDLLTEFPEATLIEGGENIGMGAGNNQAATYANGEYYLILNPDTELRPTTIETLVNYLKISPKTGIVGPKLLYPDGTRQTSCYRYPSLFMPIFRRTFLGKIFKNFNRNYLLENLDLDQPQSVDWLMGSCLLIKSSLYKDLNGFDERFFMYFEDTDLCRRITNKELQVTYLPTTEIVHHHGRASAEKHWLFSVFTSHMARVHLSSFFKYLLKWSI